MMKKRIALISTGGTIEKSYDEMKGVLQNQVSNLDVMLGTLELNGVEIVVDRIEGPCRVFPIGAWSAVFPDGVSLEARAAEDGRLVVIADGEPAWLPGERRLPVAWYQRGANGYLSVFATEEPTWT